MAERRTFELEILTPEHRFYAGPAEALVLPAVDGQLGIEPGHEPAVTAIEPGELRFLVDGAWQPVVVGAGFAEIKGDYAVLLVGFAENPQEVDLRRAEAARNGQKSDCVSGEALKNTTAPRLPWLVPWHG